MRHIYGVFRDADHRLIYVGITCNPAQRMQAHRSTTAPGPKEDHYMEIFESGENLTVEDENFWISYMAGLGCELKNRIGVKYGKRDTSHRTDLETVMKRERIRPERIAINCDMPLNTVWRAIKGMPINPVYVQAINRFFGRKEYKDRGINFQLGS